MPAPKPLVFSLLGLLGRLPERPLLAATRALNAAGLRAGGFGPNMRRTFARVRAFQGRPASDEELDALMRAFHAYYAGSLANFCRVCAAAREPRPPVPVELPFLPELQRLRRRGKGVILATPHFGDLYSAILALASAAGPLTVLMVGGRNLRWAGSDRLRFVEFLGGAAECLGALGRNECVLVYDDLDFVPGNRTAELFGAPVFPPHGPARLALETGAAILPVAAPWSRDKTEVVCDAPILPDGRTQEELEAACLRALERLIARAPEQWMILYDLWDLEAMRKAGADFRRRGRPRPDRRSS